MLKDYGMHSTRLIRLLLILTTLLIVSAASAQVQIKLNQFGIMKRDYAGNLPATDSWRWYHEDNPSNAVVEYGGVVYHGVEFEQSDMYSVTHGSAQGVVYKKGASSFSVTFTVRNENSNGTVIGSFQMLEARLMVPTDDPAVPDYVTLSPSDTSSHSFSLAYGAQTSYTITFSGLPQSVALGKLQVRYSMPVSQSDGEGGSQQGNNGTGSGYDAWEWIYVVLDDPQGLQAIPFVDFLNLNCRWGYGATNAGELRTAMTYGMHYSLRSPTSRLHYVPSEQNFNYFNSASSMLYFLLRKFCRLTQTNVWTDMDCYAFGGFLSLALESHGVDAHITRIQRDVGPSFTFLTNPLRPAGTFPYVPAGGYTLDYDEFEFKNHVISSDQFQNSIMSPPSSMVGYRYDSSSEYLHGLSGAMDKLPAVGWPGDAHWYSSASIGLSKNAYYYHTFSFPWSSLGIGTWTSNGSL